jgi:hypothetical protein
MHLDWGVFKRHPYLTGIGAVAVFVVVYLIKANSASSNSATTTSATGTTAADLQLAQLQAAQSSQQLQAQVQLQTVAAQAGVQSQQISASQEVTDNQTAAQLAAIQAQVTGQTTLGVAQVQGQDSQAQTYAGIIESQYQSQTDQHQATVDYLNNLTNAQAGVAIEGIDANAAIQSQAITAQSTEQAAALAQVPALASQFQHLGTGENYNNELIGLLGTATGQSSVGSTAVNASSNEVAATTSSASSVINSIGNAAGGVLATLLG